MPLFDLLSAEAVPAAFSDATSRALLKRQRNRESDVPTTRTE